MISPGCPDRCRVGGAYQHVTDATKEQRENLRRPELWVRRLKLDPCEERDGHDL